MIDYREEQDMIKKRKNEQSKVCRKQRLERQLRGQEQAKKRTCAQEEDKTKEVKEKDELQLKLKPQKKKAKISAT
jgi:hypothetical protein